MKTIPQGTLYLLATPLGNLGDASTRMLQVLRDCDLIAAEDTRVAARLLAGLGIQGKSVISVRQHNERQAASRLARQYAGQAIAYLSDAGTPAISDPGAKLVSHLRSNGFTVVPIPGPSAVATAFCVAGFDAPGFVSAGFLPRQKKAWKEKIGELASIGLPLVVLEAPGRVATTLTRLADHFGPAVMVCLCQELTKLHEQIINGTAAELAAKMEDGSIPARGEFTLVINPPATANAASADALRIGRMLLEELPPAKAAKLAAKITGADARALYRQLIKMQDGQ